MIPSEGRLSLGETAGTPLHRALSPCLFCACFSTVHISAALKCIRYKQCRQDINWISAENVDVTKAEEEKLALLGVREVSTFQMWNVCNFAAARI